MPPAGRRTRRRTAFSREYLRYNCTVLQRCPRRTPRLRQCRDTIAVFYKSLCIRFDHYIYLYYITSNGTVFIKINLATVYKSRHLAIFRWRAPSGWSSRLLSHRWARLGRASWCGPAVPASTLAAAPATAGPDAASAALCCGGGGPVSAGRKDEAQRPAPLPRVPRPPLPGASHLPRTRQRRDLLCLREPRPVQHKPLHEAVAASVRTAGARAGRPEGAARGASEAAAEPGERKQPACRGGTTAVPSSRAARAAPDGPESPSAPPARPAATQGAGGLAMAPAGRCAGGSQHSAQRFLGALRCSPRRAEIVS